ncbi:MAG TPA: hypothetical protein PLM98_13685 [Thiolinea sp.]|nr:hypothetical protein [Thiolinea sp.]
MNKLSIKRQTGAGLIEILISVVVLAVGLIGIASMQVRSVKNNVSALEHSIAVIQAQSMGDTLSISRPQALAGNFNISLTASDPSSANFATASVSQWRSSIRNLLGEDATGSVNCVSPNCTIIVQWNNGRATEGSTAQQIRIEMRL